MVINIAAFTDNVEIMRGLIRGAALRDMALNLAYSIDGYHAAPLAVKNWIYDQIMQRLERME